MKKESISICKIKNGTVFLCEDEAAVEAVYQVYLNGEKAFRVSCTPDDLKELITGRLYTGKLIRKKQEIDEIIILEEKQEIYVKIKKESFRKNTENHLPKEPEQKETILQDRRIPDPKELFSIADHIFENPGELFRDTGCAHSCVLWKSGEICCRYEDIGRHNALDKVAGYMLLKDISPENGVIFTSGRISADYLEKVIAAGISAVVSKAAVTEAAIYMARKNKIIMYGFVRNGNGNLYSDSMSENRFL